MISQIRGILLEKSPPELVIDVSGVGYEIFAPMGTFYHLPEIHQEVRLFTHMVVREDAQLLYGFFEKRERSLFRSLIRVNGVGPKLALAILSGIEADNFVRCIRQNDSSNLVKIPGVGKKTAERLIIETRDVLAKWEVNVNGSSSLSIDSHNMNQTMDDAISALTALGYKPNDAKRAISKVHQKDLTSEELIRLALRQMV